jgi:hypothetical protein
VSVIDCIVQALNVSLFYIIVIMYPDCHFIFVDLQMVENQKDDQIHVLQTLILMYRHNNKIIHRISRSVIF